MARPSSPAGDRQSFCCTSLKWVPPLRLGKPMRHDDEITGATFNKEGTQRIATVGWHGLTKIWNASVQVKNSGTFRIHKLNSDHLPGPCRLQSAGCRFSSLPDQSNHGDRGWRRWHRKAILWNTSYADQNRFNRCLDKSERINRVVYDV